MTINFTDAEHTYIENYINLPLPEEKYERKKKKKNQLSMH